MPRINQYQVGKKNQKNQISVKTWFQFWDVYSSLGRLYTKRPRVNSLQGQTDFPFFFFYVYFLCILILSHFERLKILAVRNNLDLATPIQAFSQCAALFEIYRQKSRRFTRLPLWVNKANIVIRRQHCIVIKTDLQLMLDKEYQNKESYIFFFLKESKLLIRKGIV